VSQSGKISKSEAAALGRKSMSSRKATLIESTLVLALLGILAGAIGGLAVGAVTMPKTASSSAAR
jgi:hypothetical protein